MKVQRKAKQLRKIKFLELKSKSFCSLYFDEIGSVEYSPKYNSIVLTNLLGDDFYVHDEELLKAIEGLELMFEPGIVDAIHEVSEECIRK